MAIHRKSSRGRLVLAIVLIAASLVSAFIFSSLANQKTSMIVSTNFLLPGHQIIESDLTQIQVSLGEVADNYVSDASQIVGSFTKVRIEAHELISTSSLSSQSDAISLSSVPLSIRSADAPDGLIPGASVDIYWVQDDTNADMQLIPELVVVGAHVLAITKSGSNFGSEVGLTVAISSEDVLLLLGATSQGRVVLVSSHG
ncbi:MAG: SAF domain-containing protein [Actinobacteria bacterium]|nr:SAF domain-containing protein [Actinomycetota bacterium]